MTTCLQFAPPIRNVINALLVVLLLTPAALWGQVPMLSDSSRITLLTVTPGEELYSAFGHTGIRVTDYKNDFDVVFNYGTFDFEQEGFYVNFVKGKMLYRIGVESFAGFYNSYIEEKRGVTEQVLRLTTEEKKQVFAFLYNNTLPENRNYYYDFFWDNCATRPRDVFEKILGKRLQYHTENAGFETGKTMHDMLRIYVNKRPWVDFGFDLILGLPCEVEATPRSQTFLPDYLAKYFDCATVDGQPFVTSKEVLIKYEPVYSEDVFTPKLLCGLLALIALAIAVYERYKSTHNFKFDFALFLVAGLLGLLFLCLGLFTAHYSTPKNMNMLWLIPTHAIVAGFLLKANKPGWLKYYFALTGILMLILLVAWPYMPQPYSPVAKWLVFALGLRAFTITDYLRRTK